MFFFDRYRKSKMTSPATAPDSSSPAGTTLPQLTYDIAYFILPQYAHQRVEKIVELYTTQPRAAGPFFYAMACVARKIEPSRQDAEQFRWHHGDLDDAREYFILEFPVPPPVDLSGVSPEQIVSAQRVTLAPHFAAVLLPKSGGPADYYILGQAPLGGGTTLRTVTADGANANLGPGPTPNLEAFLQRLRRH